MTFEIGRALARFLRALVPPPQTPAATALALAPPTAIDDVPDAPGDGTAWSEMTPRERLAAQGLLPRALPLPEGAAALPPGWAVEQRRDGTYTGLLRAQRVPQAAARAFARWLRESGEAEVSARQMWSLYLEHCEIARVTPLPSNVLLAALAEQPGLTRREAKGMVRNGKRYRPTVWSIEPLREASATPRAARRAARHASRAAA